MKNRSLVNLFSSNKENYFQLLVLRLMRDIVTTFHTGGVYSEVSV